MSAEDQYKCLMCQGEGKYPVTIDGEDIWFACQACEGDGRARIVITCEEYDELRNCKFMYEGVSR